MLKIETDLMIFFLKLYLRVAKLGEIKKFSDDRNCWTFRVLRLSFQGTLLISCYTAYIAHSTRLVPSNSNLLVFERSSCRKHRVFRFFDFFHTCNFISYCILYQFQSSLGCQSCGWK